MIDQSTLNDIAVIIFARNEQRTVGLVIQECRAIGLHVLVMDDFSTDGTHETALHAGAEVLRNQNHQGIGFSLRRACRHLQQQGYLIVVTIDGDGAHLPSAIPALVKSHFLSSADLTIGSRFLKGPMDYIPSAKVAANKFATFLINKILARSLSDVASGMRVLGSRLIRQRLSTRGFSVMYDMIANAVDQNMIVNEYAIPVRYDALKPFCTNAGELQDLLQITIKLANSRGIPHKLCLIHSKVKRFEELRINLDGELVVAHPCRIVGGYLFQIQHPWYTAQQVEKHSEWITPIS